MADRVEDTLKGGYGGLYGEVVTCDTYRVRELHFKPDVVLDLGANVGIFARFARELWPKADIVCVEPDADNFNDLVRFTPAERVTFLNRAIGTHPVWRHPGAVNGAHECYLGPYPGTTNEDLSAIPGAVQSGVMTVMPDDLVARYSKSTDRLLIKMDIEGAENAVWAHRASVEAMARADYIAGELHGGGPQAAAAAASAFALLGRTHDVNSRHVNFWATKRGH